MPKCIFVNTFYSGFLNSHYRNNPKLAQCSYGEQLRSLNDANFGDSDYYSEGLRRAGWLAADLIVNCDPLQQAWARENDLATSGLQIAVEQIRLHRPDVVYVQDLNGIPKAFLDAIRDRVGMIVGQIATPIVAAIPFGSYDLLISSLPHYVERFRRDGLCAYCQPLAFAPRVVDAIGARKTTAERSIDCSFVGGISTLHIEGNALLEDLANQCDVKFWGYGAEQLPPTSSIRPRHQGEAWGIDMLSTLADSKITINRHGEIAERFANNMRLFEACGCGALLITDHKDNLDDLFEVGEEVVAYRSREECVALVRYYLRHQDEAQAIARAGQERVLRDHSYTQRMAQTAELLERHLRLRAEKDRYPRVDPATVSSAYRAIEPEQVTEQHRQAWTSELIPERQRALVQQELEAMYKGRPAMPFRVLAKLLAPHLRPGQRALEIGCASGYYYEVLEYLMGQQIDYIGVDYSEPLIAMARDYYPKGQFVVADGAALPFADNSVQVAISSSVLLHVTDWKTHIREAARVAAKTVVLHRTPVCRKGDTRFMTKEAYGVETVELVFSEEELIHYCLDLGLEPTAATQYGGDEASDEYLLSYVLDKRIACREQVA